MKQPKLSALSCLFLSIICLFPAGGIGQSDNWNTSSGGNSAHNGLSLACGPAEKDVLWEGGLVSVIGFPLVVDGNVVATSRIFDLGNTLDGTLIVAMDLTTGDTLWTAQLPVDFPATDWRNRVSAIRNGQVYATRSGNTNYSYLYALDVADGSILWKSEDLINEGSTESAAFMENGDLIIGNNDSVLRIDHQTGETVWMTSRSTPTSNGQEVSLFGDKGYYWEQSPAGPMVSVIDLDTGSQLYSSDGLGGLTQQTNLFIGTDGTIYAPRNQNNPLTDSLYAFSDTGSGLEKIWSIPLGYLPFATFGVGPDGSVYSYSRTGKVVRLDPENGVAVDSSFVIISGPSPSPRMAIDANGRVFITNDDGPYSNLYAFNPDLSLRWADGVPNVNIGGPAMGADGTLVVCGTGNLIRAYSGSDCTTVQHELATAAPEFDVYPNPAAEFIFFGGGIVDSVTVRIIDARGIEMRRYEGVRSGIPYSVRGLEPGWYVIQICNAGKQLVRPLIIR